MRKAISKSILFIIIVNFIYCNFNQQSSEKMNTEEEEDISELYAELLSCEPAEGDTSFGCVPYEMTFIEFGSVNCIPCKKMQPVMKSIQEKYRGKVKVIFCDTRKNRKLARVYNIWIIPTQVFIDADGDEVMLHRGFVPEAEIITVLKSQGIEPSTQEY